MLMSALLCRQALKRPKQLVRFPDDLWALILQFFTYSLRTWAFTQAVNQQWRRCARKPQALAFVPVVLGQASYLGRLGTAMPGLHNLTLESDDGLAYDLQFKALRRLRLTALNYEGIPFASPFPHLQELEFHTCFKLTNEHLASVGALDTLLTLKLDGCTRLTDLRPLSNMTTLATLSLTGSSVFDLTPLKALPLVTLVLDSNSVIGKFDENLMKI